MNFLSVTSDMQTLELTYSLHLGLSKQSVSFSKCTDISLGLIETNGLKAVLSAQASLLSLENTLITLRKIECEHLENDKSVVRLEPLQQMNLSFEMGRTIIDDMPLLLSEETPYYPLVQHLVIGRLEYILAEMDIFHLDIRATTTTKTFAELLKQRTYQYSKGRYSKYLLMTNTVNVIP